MYLIGSLLYSSCKMKYFSVYVVFVLHKAILCMFQYISKCGTLKQDPERVEMSRAHGRIKWALIPISNPLGGAKHKKIALTDPCGTWHGRKSAYVSPFFFLLFLCFTEYVDCMQLIIFSCVLRPSCFSQLPNFNLPTCNDIVVVVSITTSLLALIKTYKKFCVTRHTNLCNFRLSLALLFFFKPNVSAAFQQSSSVTAAKKTYSE